MHLPRQRPSSEFCRDILLKNRKWCGVCFSTFKNRVEKKDKLFCIRYGKSCLPGGERSFIAGGVEVCDLKY